MDTGPSAEGVVVEATLLHVEGAPDDDTGPVPSDGSQTPYPVSTPTVGPGTDRAPPTRPTGTSSPTDTRQDPVHWYEDERPTSYSSSGRKDSVTAQDPTSHDGQGRESST